MHDYISGCATESCEVLSKNIPVTPPISGCPTESCEVLSKTNLSRHQSYECFELVKLQLV
ncbi:hypothetical protein BgiMline_009139, partial [Biomphalaria glabrata]